MNTSHHPHSPRTAPTRKLIAQIFLLTLVLLSVCAGISRLALQAAGLSTAPTASVPTFESATRLYELGKFQESALAYDTLLATGLYSPTLSLNAGNAWLKAGHPGRAIAHYRRGLRETPRDPDLIANLRFARNRATPTEAPREGWLESQISRLSLKEWAWTTLLTTWTLTIVLAGVTLVARELSAPWKLGIAAASAAFLVAQGGAWLAHQHIAQTRFGVVIQNSAAVRLGPLEESQATFDLADGTEVGVVETRPDWARIRTPSGRQGWMRASSLVSIDQPWSSSTSPTPQPR